MLFAVSCDCYLGAASLKLFVALTTLIFLTACCGCGGQAQQIADPPPTESPATIEPQPSALQSYPPTPVPKSRKFVFHYKFLVKDLKPTGNAEEDVVKVWLPHPARVCTKP